MVFWSSFSKKIKQAVSQISFDSLKRKVETIESDYATKTYTDQQNQAQDTKIASNTSNITNNSNNINTLDTKVDGVISGLQNGNIVNYAGEFNSSTNYKLAQAVTLNGEWFVSKQNNNQGHAPTKTNNAYWVYISAPTVDLTQYLTKSEASSTYLLKTMLNTMYPVGSVVMTADNSVHAMVNQFPGKFTEITDSDLSYLAIGSGTVSNTNTGTFRINQNNLPNINWQWKTDWNTSMTPTQTDLQAYVVSGSASMEHRYNDVGKRRNSGTNSNDGLRASVYTRINLNGNVSQSPITYTIKPKTLKIRMWKVIANLI